MKQFKVACDEFSKVLTAMTKEEAVDMAMNDADVKAHMMEKHMDLMGKPAEELKIMMMGMVEEVMETPAM